MWEKKGLIYNVNGSNNWNKSHAQVPVVDVLENTLRIYYSSRCVKGKSRISFIEVEKRNPKDIIYIHNEPLLEFGNKGTFDESGQMPTCVYTIGNVKYLYFIGWSERKQVPYHNSLGVAVSYDGGISFEKMYDGPLLGVTKNEPFFNGTAFVKEFRDELFMWYLSCIGWQEFDGKLEPLYNIKVANSEDLINWNQLGNVAIELKDEEGGLASATVVESKGQLIMWFSSRNKSDYRSNSLNSYKILSATSKDGYQWNRKVECGLSLSRTGWDSEMVAYPYVVEFDNKYYMFYNGNGFGKSGFGYATMEKSILDGYDF